MSIALSPIPAPHVPITNPDKPGVWRVLWYNYVRNIDQVLRQLFSSANPTTFALRPATPAAGMLATFTDSNTTVWGAVIAGGGTNTVLAFYNGTNWTVAGH